MSGEEEAGGGEAGHPGGYQLTDPGAQQVIHI